MVYNIIILSFLILIVRQTCLFSFILYSVLPLIILFKYSINPFIICARSCKELYTVCWIFVYIKKIVHFRQLYRKYFSFFKFCCLHSERFIRVHAMLRLISYNQYFMGSIFIKYLYVLYVYIIGNKTKLILGFTIHIYSQY